MKIEKKYRGCIAIMGQTNVGKSTLLNVLIGYKISIVSHKKNTTQKNITGIKTDQSHQFIYIDTPGINIKNKYTKKKERNFYCSDISCDV
ncbi:50S ribosome-binding GTPase, partial [Buchnera aphidicola]|nr:50S ribosome-binding GTPase [Buchnera aphidicola]